MSHESTGRRIENWLAILGVLQAVFASSMETLVDAGFKLGVCPAPREHWWSYVPWFNLAVLLVCVLPKTLGRMTAGKVWETLAGKIPGGTAGA